MLTFLIRIVALFALAAWALYPDAEVWTVLALFVWLIILSGLFALLVTPLVIEVGELLRELDRPRNSHDA